MSRPLYACNVYFVLIIKTFIFSPSKILCRKHETLHIVPTYHEVYFEIVEPSQILPLVSSTVQSFYAQNSGLCLYITHTTLNFVQSRCQIEDFYPRNKLILVARTSACSIQSYGSYIFTSMQQIHINSTAHTINPSPTFFVCHSIKKIFF